MAFVNECEVLDQIIDRMTPVFEKKFIKTVKDCQDIFGLSMDNLIYIDQSGRREGCDSSMNWLISPSDQLYFYFGRYTAMGPEDKSPFVEVGLVFWRDKVFHFHFHQMYVPDELKNHADSNTQIFIEVCWVVFLIDYVSGWGGLDCREKLVKKMILKIAESIQSIGFAFGVKRYLNAGVYYISDRLESETDFEWELK